MHKLRASTLIPRAAALPNCQCKGVRVYCLLFCVQCVVSSMKYAVCSMWHVMSSTNSAPSPRPPCAEVHEPSCLTKHIY